MSSIIVTENFRNVWKTGVLRQLSERQQNLRDYILPPQVAVQEPLPEELDDVMLAMAPLIASGTINATSIALTLAAHAGAMGARPESLYPLYYMAGTSELSSNAGGIVLLQHGEVCGMPIIYTGPFPVSVGNECIPRLRSGLNESWRNRIAFMMYDNVLVDINQFQSPETRDEWLGLGAQIAPPYRGAPSGWCIRSTSTAMRYTGCFRLPTAEEIDAHFASIPIGTVLNFDTWGLRDFFGAYGIRDRDVEISLYSDPAASVPSATPRAGAATNVPAQDFSTEIRRPNTRRVVIGGQTARPRPGTRARPGDAFMTAAARQRALDELHQEAQTLRVSRMVAPVIHDEIVFESEPVPVPVAPANPWFSGTAAAFNAFSETAAPQSAQVPPTSQQQ